MKNYLNMLWLEADAAWDRDPGGAEWLRAVNRVLAFWSSCTAQG